MREVAMLALDFGKSRGGEYEDLGLTSRAQTGVIDSREGGCRAGLWGARSITGAFSVDSRDKASIGGKAQGWAEGRSSGLCSRSGAFDFCGSGLSILLRGGGVNAPGPGSVKGRSVEFSSGMGSAVSGDYGENKNIAKARRECSVRRLVGVCFS